MNGYRGAVHYWSFDTGGQSATSQDLSGNNLVTLKDGALIIDSVHRKKVCSTVESGGYLDFGSFSGECLVNPDQCSHGLGVMFWIRIQAENVAKGSEYQYILSSGAEGRDNRGLALLYKVGILHFYV